MPRFRVIEGPVPLHHQVYLDLRDALDGGEWTPGDRLPPERELAERYGVSLITVRRALTDLAREHRLERTRGRGTFVTRSPIPLDLDAPISFTEEIRRLGHAPATRIVTARTMGAEPAVADALGIAHGAQVVHLERLRMADGEPLLLEQVYLPEARFPGLLADDLEHGSLYELLQERYGTNVVRAREALEPGGEVSPAFEPSLFRVALTFDAEHPDRPHRPGIASDLLDVMADRGVASTWFLQGRWVEAEPALARRVASDGHLVGNHGFYHARMPLLTVEGLATDVRAAELAIREATDVDPRPWFRCPFFAGSDDRRVLAALAALGYRDIPADVVLDDWEPSRTGAAMAAEALALAPSVGDGAVVLFHSWPPGALEALPLIIDGLRDLGATFVRVDELERFAA